MKFLLLLLLLPGLSQTTSTTVNRTLLLVQAVWRHGDRSPTKTYTKDIYQEDSWKFGGSGWGQLSPVGMHQHLVLGAKVRQRYVIGDKDKNVGGFLNSRYDSHEIYIRSTDVNRTIISAMSNMIGMYGQESYNNTEGTDYPNNTYTTDTGLNQNVTWPKGFIPIAVHTVDDDTDYIGNADATCARQTQLWEMAKSSPELVAYQKSPSVSGLLKNLTQWCGGADGRDGIDIDNLWVVADSFLIGKLWQPGFPGTQTWYSDALNDQTVIVNDQVELYQNGVFNNTPLIMNNLDIGVEIQKIRGGSLTNDILMHANIKTECMLKGSTDGGCKWISKLKYYVYSAHDTTLYAFFSCLGIQSKVVAPHGYPKYSAAAFFELWWNNDKNITEFRLMFHDGDDTEIQGIKDDTSGFRAITQDIAGCDGEEFCDLTVYKGYAARVKPDMPMDQWCNVNPNTQAPPPSSTTTVKPTTPSSTGLLSTFTGIFIALFMN